jgi:LPS-assembly lipoprotein
MSSARASDRKVLRDLAVAIDRQRCGFRMSPMRSKKALWAFGLFLLGAPLSGCIQPLYGPLADGGGSVATEMQAVSIEPIPDRLGHYLENELIFGFNGTGSRVPPRYRLFVSVTEATQTPLVDTVTGQASAANVLVTANFRLEHATGGPPIYKDTATVVASYDRTTQRFASVRAARDAEIRDAERLADQIRTRIAAIFAAGAPPQAPAPVVVPKS